MNTVQDPRPLFERAAGQTASLISDVRPEQLDLPTPCPGFDIRHLVGHLVEGVNRLAGIGESIPAEPFAEREARVPDGEWAREFAAAQARYRLAWADDTLLDSPVTMPRAASGRETVAGYVMELTAHDWDLARALDDPRPLDSELAEYALAVALRTVPEDHRGGVWPFGPPRPAPEEADSYQRLAAWLGRPV
ncbi:TIGR03086 family metal-binding protein [Streptomyces sp. ACA25]|uniref:TIGR03086 family metal-binding protein n=1 Tax=Streptomyces sp. ACA25 TaxID=3022596 RepID=UPI0023074D23|nr:TIGR03086 family metal-binding protein [Streptomyces sp. ACA25]MDB1088362.1 TIGR03086 family metal-binding protein [Streptomyces sp. ACA25]